VTQVAAKRARVLLHGAVQGVGFRYFAKREADRRRIVGYVRNLPNGSVEVEAEGEAGLLTDFLAVLRVGPRWGYISAVDLQSQEPLLREERFEIRF
jgi:acylphosphatase